jgi:hypothetical protein
MGPPEGRIGPTAASADVDLFVRAVYLQSSYMPGNVVVIIIQDTKIVGTREFLFVSCLQLLCLAAACSYGQASFETAIPATKKCHIEIVIYIHMLPSRFFIPCTELSWVLVWQVAKWGVGSGTCTPSCAVYYMCAVIASAFLGANPPTDKALKLGAFLVL